MQVCWSCKAPINTPEEKDYAALWFEGEDGPSVAFLCKECYDKPEFEDIGSEIQAER